jgi:hypothetical protein
MKKKKSTRKDRRSLLLLIGEALSLYALENEPRKPMQTAQGPEPRSTRQVLQVLRRTA